MLHGCGVKVARVAFCKQGTCGREGMKRIMQFYREPRKLPIVLSVEEVADLLAAVPGPGLKIIVSHIHGPFPLCSATQ